MIAELRGELKRTQDEISSATARNAGLGGGLLKALMETRIELLKTTEALLVQRILAEDIGVPLTITIPATNPEPEVAASLAGEIETQQHLLEATRADAARFVGGLVHALKLSTVATQEQSLAMLRQRYLIAKYGLSFPSKAISGVQADTIAPTAPIVAVDVPARSIVDPIIGVRLLKKQFTKQSYQDYIFFDAEFSAPGLKRPARAIKGRLLLKDLFGETKMTIEWTLEKPPNPGEAVVEKGKGFHHNQFLQPHQWVNSTTLQDMCATFDVSSILYQDGSREDLP